MGRALAWYKDNDMRIRLDKLQTSTMGSTEYLNSSTGVNVEIWDSGSTASTANLVVTSKNMSYVSGSNGRYEVIIESTQHSMALRTNGMAKITVEHSAVDGDWRPKFLVQTRRST